jgi:hypothetical protein
LKEIPFHGLVAAVKKIKYIEIKRDKQQANSSFLCPTAVGYIQFHVTRAWNRQTTILVKAFNGTRLVGTSAVWK